MMSKQRDLMLNPNDSKTRHRFPSEDMDKSRFLGFYYDESVSVVSTAHQRQRP